MASGGITEWRCRIGTFAGYNICSRMRRNKLGNNSVNNPGQRILLLAMLLVYADISNILLVKEGVEQNPGPNKGNS